MKHLSSFAVLSGLALVISACATATGEDQTTTLVDAGSLHDAKLDSRANPDGKANDGGGSQCTSQCTSDQDCQNSCPDPGQGGLNCCDSQTGICYVESSSTCPSPPDASSGGG